MAKTEILSLLQKLATVLDSGHGTELERQSFECILEILNENIKTTNISSGRPSDSWPTPAEFKSLG